MKRIKLILLSDPQTQNLGGSNSSYADPSTTVRTLSAIRDTVYPDRAKYRIPQGDIENSPAYLQAVRFSSPNLDSKDVYPGNESPLIGSEQSKTLGSYPLFSGAALYPADIWAKRRAAIGDYMLKLEAAKSGPLVKTAPAPLIEGGATLGGAFNQALISDLKDIQTDASQRGVSAYDAIDNSSNPYYSQVSGKIRKYQSLGATAKAIEGNIGKVNSEFLNAGNTYSNATAQAINEYNQIASAPVQHQVEAARMNESDTHNDLQSHLNKLNYRIAAIPSLPTVVDQRIKNIQQKSQQSIQSLGSSSGLDEWISRGAESAYPPEVFAKNPKTGEYLKDANGNPMLDAGAKEDFLTKQAMVIAKDKQPLFNDYDKNSDKDAPFSVDDIKKELEASLGYKLTTAVHTASEPGAGSKNEVSAVPQYVANKVSDLSTPGKEINIKKGYSITAGQGYTTFNENGVQTVVANSNRPELVKHLISAGAIEPGQMGAVDAASAQINANSNPALWKELSKYTSNTERPEIKETDSPIQNFNNRIDALSGGAGISIDGSDNKVAKATIAKKGTSDFFLDINNKDEGKTQGVLIPNGTITTMFKEPGWTSKVASALGASGISEWLKNDKKAYVSGGGDAFAMGDVYYHKDEPDANGVTYYTVYDKKTDKPHQVDVKQPGGGVSQQQIKVPSFQIEKMLNAPKELLDKAKPTEQDISSPSGGASVEKNIATKTAKGQSATPKTDKVSDDDSKAAQYILGQKWAKSPEEAAQMVQQYKVTTDTKQKNNWNIIQQRIKGK